ncbi:MAG: caspase family protein [Bacteroidetes bacterium]|nr:caspase family protein [Bacteroidota bacterium]
MYLVKLKFLLLFLVAGYCAKAQVKYGDIQPSQKTVFLTDAFDRNSDWTLERAKFEEGKLVLKKGKATRFIDLDFTRSFEIEIMIASSHPQGYYQIKLGNNVIDISPKFTGHRAIDTKMVNACKVIADGEIGSNYDGTDIEAVNLQKDQFSKYTIRKIDNLYYIFINERPVLTYYFPPFKEIGIKPKFFYETKVDSFTISYLDTGEKIAAVTPTKALPAAGTVVSPGKGKYYALLIGVSDYADNRLDLERPVKDAQHLGEVLRTRYTFSDSTVTILMNPTRQNILVALFQLRKTITPQDNFLIFYAGHGYWDEDARQGYWWARDAAANDPSNWLSNSDVREQIRSIKAAHTLLISDACFSGGIFKTRSASAIQTASLDIQMLYKLPSRRAITSGTMTTVPDNSLFFDYLSKRLEENQEPFMTSQQLFDSFRQAVINNSMVVPQDGVIADAGDEGGDFVFIRKEKGK